MNIFKLTERFILSWFEPKSLLIWGFVLTIFSGSLLLTAPFALNTGKSITFIDALFTSASATCVTGLAVVDTGSHFSLYGQIIILFLIQIGGLGVMSFSTLFLFYLRGKFGMGSREIIQETLSFFDTTDIAALLKSVFVFTFSFEAAGSILLTSRFMFDMPFEKALFAGIFHSISAFCNAGFSIFPDSLMSYRSDIFVNVVIMILIITGGIGFIVMYEFAGIHKKRFLFHRFSLHTKVTLLYSAVLILAGAVFLFISEYNVSMQGFDFKSRVLSSLFQSISPRTAGFNTLDIGSFSIISLFIIISLMFIGASPASCGGGMKVSTIAVLFAFIRSRIKEMRNVNLFYSTLPMHIVSKATMALVFGIITVVLFSFIISIFELGNTAYYNNSSDFIRVFFEVVSAFGTVGLSTGITAALTDFSKIALSFLMLIGRIGPLTIVLAAGTKEEPDIRFAEDNILVG